MLCLSFICWGLGVSSFQLRGCRFSFGGIRVVYGVTVCRGVVRGWYHCRLFFLLLRGGAAGGLVVGGGTFVKTVTTSLMPKRTAVTRGGTMGTATSEPGVVFVLTSSLKCNSLSYCNDGAVGAPGVSGLTTANAQFGRDCTKSNVDSPSHYTLVANGGAKGDHVQSGVYATKKVANLGVGPGNSAAVIHEADLRPRSAAVTAMLRTTNCGAYLIGG